MSDLAIQVRDLSKVYYIGKMLNMDETLASRAMKAIKGPARRLMKLARGQQTGAAELDENFWALQDINFDLKQGEVVGIIGRNGAGKSTLLKILSQITYPTKGRIELTGRVGSLLEVGTGFHDELTGRENVFLNGTILGMSRVEVQRKFDEIVDFAGVEQFIDTPVKHYSSGMKVRLAFAVAAHLEPEILLVDEVLSVGDAEFQNRSINKMNAVANDGRTVLIVSHNLATIQALTTRCIVLQNGRIVCDSDVETAIEEYIKAVNFNIRETPLAQRLDREGGTEFVFNAVRFENAETGFPLQNLISGQPINIHIDYTCLNPNGLNNLVIGISFYNRHHSFLFACRSDVHNLPFDIESGNGTVTFHMDKWHGSGGRYYYNTQAKAGSATVDWVKQAGFIDSELGDYYGTGRLPAKGHQGVFVDFKFQQHIQLKEG